MLGERKAGKTKIKYIDLGPVNKGTAKQPDDKMTLVSSYQLVITLNGNVFNLQIKKQSSWMDKKQD